MEKVKVEILRSCGVGDKSYQVGKVVSVAQKDAHELIGLGKARLVEEQPETPADPEPADPDKEPDDGADENDEGEGEEGKQLVTETGGKKPAKRGKK